MADTDKKVEKTTKQEEEVPANEIRVGRQRRSEAYVKQAEALFLDQEEIVLCGLGNTIRTVVSCAEIMKFRKYATVTKIETSMIEGDRNQTNSVPKIRIFLKRNPGILEYLKKIAEERKNESEYEKHLREQEERERDKEQDL